MAKKQITKQMTPLVIIATSDRFFVVMSPADSDQYPLLSHHTIDDDIYRVTAHLNNGENVSVQFTKV